MTVIVANGKEMAADSIAVVGSRRTQAARPKIVRRADGWLAGAAGTTPRCDAFMEWFHAGADPHTRPTVPSDSNDCELDALVLTTDGLLFRSNHRYELYAVRCPYAIGEEAAASMAFAALCMGASCAEAVALAIEHSIYVGGPVQVEWLEPIRLPVKR